MSDDHKHSTGGKTIGLILLAALIAFVIVYFLTGGDLGSFLNIGSSSPAYGR